jgi:uncharacterized membrane protein HdeD (DUF308 family)
MNGATLENLSSIPILVRGIAGILFGLIALFLPGTALATLVLLFAAYMLVDGVFGIVAAVRAARAGERWGWFALEGVLDLAVGAVSVLMPRITVVAFILLLGVWACVTGVLLVIAATAAHIREGRGWLVFAGIVSAIWGLLLLAWPGAGAIGLVIWLGAYAFVFGIVMVVTALRMRRERRVEGLSPRGPDAAA